MAKRGVKTKYKPEYCERLIELMREGTSIVECASEFGVAECTIHVWFKKHPEFAEAKEEGVSLSKGWWMKQGRVHLENNKFNSSLWYTNMKNRFGWADKKETKLSGSVNINNILDEIEDGD